jgi:hypothetical protein
MIEKLFSSGDPDASINPDTCPHPGDRVHYLAEGFQVTRCVRCTKLLGIIPKEFPDEHQSRHPVDTDPETELLRQQREAEAKVRHPSRG